MSSDTVDSAVYMQSCCCSVRGNSGHVVQLLGVESYPQQHVWLMLVIQVQTLHNLCVHVHNSVFAPPAELEIVS